MYADLDTLCIAVYCTADDLLPAARANARRKVSDAEPVTLCVAQAIMGIPSDRRFLAVARRQLGHLFPRRPGQAGYHKRRRALAETIEWLIGVFADRSPGAGDRLLLIDSTPVECARSRETVMRSALADAADYGYSASHSRFFWGFRLHAIFAPDGTPRARALCSPKRDERAVGLELIGRLERPARTDPGGRQGLCRAGLRLRGRRPGRHDRAAPPGAMSPATARTWPRSASASSRSSSPARTCSPWSATAPAPSRACASASPNGSCAWRRASGSTTRSGDRAARSWPTWPERVESLI